MTRQRARLIPVAAAILAVGAASAAHAQGSPPAKTARYLGGIHVKGQVATLRVRYSCTSGDTLWISAKQSKGRRQLTALKKEGSSQVAAAWWDSHRNPIVCDGASHTSNFTMDKVEPGKKGQLRRGKAWVQFCITTGTTEADTVLTVSKVGWVKVKA